MVGQTRKMAGQTPHVREKVPSETETETETDTEAQEREYEAAQPTCHGSHGLADSLWTTWTTIQEAGEPARVRRPNAPPGG